MSPLASVLTQPEPKLNPPTGAWKAKILRKGKHPQMIRKRSKHFEGEWLQTENVGCQEEKSGCRKVGSFLSCGALSGDLGSADLYYEDFKVGKIHSRECTRHLSSCEKKLLFTS